MAVQLYELATSGGTTASGYFAVNTVKINGALLKHIFIDFENTTTQFEFKLIDNRDRNIIYINSCNTVLNRSYDIPLKGIYTLVVSNATVDTAFKLRFAAQDVF
jgi:hypothetical protein